MLAGRKNNSGFSLSCFKPSFMKMKYRYTSCTVYCMNRPPGMAWQEPTLLKHNHTSTKKQACFFNQATTKKNWKSVSTKTEIIFRLIVASYTLHGITYMYFLFPLTARFLNCHMYFLLLYHVSHSGFKNVHVGSSKTKFRRQNQYDLWARRFELVLGIIPKLYIDT